MSDRWENQWADLRAKLRGVPFLYAMRHPYNFIAEKFETRRCKREVKRLKNTRPTIFSNDCVGGVLMKNYGLPFNTPTVNCAINPGNFVRYLKYLEHYMGCELAEKESDLGFPVGELVSELGNIEIQFMHNSSFQEAKEAWKRRTNRIDLNNINVILDLNPYNIADDFIIREFLELPYNKVILTTDKFRNTPVSHYIDMKRSKIRIPGITLRFKNILGFRYYDVLDYIEWLNNNAKS